SVSFVPAKGDRAFGICPRFVLPDAQVLGGRRWPLGGGGGVLVSTLLIKPGYTIVEVQMPKEMTTSAPRRSKSSNETWLLRFVVTRSPGGAQETSVREGVLKC